MSRSTPRCFCPYCSRAKRLLTDKGVAFEEYDISMGGRKREEMLARANGGTRFRRSSLTAATSAARTISRRWKRPASLIRCCRPDGLRIAVYQARTGIDPAANARALATAIDHAAAGGARIIFTPEMSGLLDRDRNRAAPHYRSEADDPVLARVRDAAAGAGMWVALGSLALRGERSERLINRSFLIDEAGIIRARYDKLHLFDVDLPTGESWRESAAFEPGREAVLADTPLGLLGLSICYDLRFGALYGTYSDHGALALSIPAAFTVPTGEAHWHVLLRAGLLNRSAS
jgi:predicted amidohydrolase